MRDDRREIRHFHLFCGLGGGAKGFNLGEARVGNTAASYRCLGGIDNARAAIKDFERLAGVPGTALDLFSREQYTAFHGLEPPAGWREATPEDIRRAAGNERPHIVFTSPPCKGFSALLAEGLAGTPRYQALNDLALRGIWLTLEAWEDDPVEFILMENVPRIQRRGAHLLAQIESLLHRYGYATAPTTHDCGELGGLAQRRKRFLLVARHRAKVPPFLYEPRKRPLQAVGAVLEKFPLPGDESAGPMHRIPSLQFRTWLRLALVEAGSDWRSLKRLRVEGGYLSDYGLVPETTLRAGTLGVGTWDKPVGTVTGQSGPTNGAFAVADPRLSGRHEYGQYGVRRWSETSGTISGQSAPGGGRYSIADPRIGLGKRFNNIYRIVKWSETSPVITGGGTPSGGGLCIADPRPAWGAERQHFNSGGHYGVLKWDVPANTIPGQAKHDNGPWSVADPRLPAQTEKGVFLDTWHRPFTTLELAALQGLVDPDEHLMLHGSSDSAHRERIGNAVPPPAAAAISSVMGRTLLLAWSGKTFVLDAMPIWVRPVAVACSVDP